MKIIRFAARVFLLGFVMAIAATAVSRAADDTPQAFLEKLYANYVGPNQPGLDYSVDKVMAQYLTPEVIALMDKMDEAAKGADEVPALDGDPFVDAQEWDIAKFDISVDGVSGDKATGHVKFTNYDRTEDLILSLVKLKDGWRIDDINWGEYGTLRELLTEPNPE